MPKVYTLVKEQIIPSSLETVWDFFSSPDNLKTLTPSYMGFDIVRGTTPEMYPGQIIEYRVKPLLGIPLRWVTEITHCKEHAFFVDEQRFGPYRFWHHQHHFEERAHGVYMRDEINYALPAGIFGQIIHPVLVKSRLKEIFDYRYNTVQTLFKKD